MTTNQLLAAASAGKSVIGTNGIVGRFPAAFVCAMPFRTVATALPYMKIYKPKKPTKPRWVTRNQHLQNNNVEPV